MSNFVYKTFRIQSFQSGVNEYYTDAMLKPYEAVRAVNCNTIDGSLKSIVEPSESLVMPNKVVSSIVYYGKDKEELFLQCNDKIYDKDSTERYTVTEDKLDYLNFEYKGERVLIGCSSTASPFLYNGTEFKKLKNRRISYNDTGAIDGYIDANGVKKATEAEIDTYAPKGEFMELHYDRLWIAGDKDNPDRVYFSTAGLNGADIEDFTVPLADEEEVNMHGGFIDVRSYDGGKIIGMKVIFNSVVLFKNKTAYKIYGSNPSNYQLVEIFSCNGAIADNSICVGDNGAYFLNKDGIYYFDGTNTTLISQKIKNTIAKMNKNYASKSVATYFNSKYYIAIPLEDSTENNCLIIYDTINKSFMTYELGNISSFIEYNNELCYTSENKMFNINKGETYKPMLWETPNYDFGIKNARKMSEYIYFRGKGEGKVKFTLQSERKAKTLELKLDSTERLYKKKLKNKGRVFKLLIENIDNSNIEIISPEIVFEIDED